MKYLIIIGDGMADHPIKRLNGKTPLQYADKPGMDILARNGRTGRLITVPQNFQPGSEIANLSILGYDLNKVYEGRGPLEAASIGYKMQPDDLALRCNIITIADGKIKNHNGGHLSTQEGDALIKYLDSKLSNADIKFITGIQYRHLLIIRNGNKHIICAPPHDHPNELWQQLMAKSESDWENKNDGTKLSGQETADIINSLIIKSQELLKKHPLNIDRMSKGLAPANCIWPWGGGYKPRMEKIHDKYPQIRNGAVISAVDLIRGIGYYAGLDIIKVEGATGLADTNYEAKAQAAIEALKTYDLVYLHVEASDEASHDGNLNLKIKTIENLDKRIIRPIYHEVSKWHDTQIRIAVLPDHPTPVELRTHINEPVPFLIWGTGITPDNVDVYDEISCANGAYGMVGLGELMKLLLNY